MKSKNKRILKQLVALILAIVLVSSNMTILEVFAIDPTNKVDKVTNKGGEANAGSSAGNGTGASYDFDIKSFADTSQCISSRAYLITIQKLENNSCVPHKI